jgi:signal peptidase I
MASTLQVDDHVVISCKSTEEPSGVHLIGEHLILIKRVIGVPGDQIHLRDRIISWNRVPRREPHAAKPPYSDYNAYRDDFPAIAPTSNLGVTAQWSVELPGVIENSDVVVPSDSYFVIGDNRRPQP